MASVSYRFLMKIWSSPIKPWPSMRVSWNPGFPDKINSLGTITKCSLPSRNISKSKWIRRGIKSQKSLKKYSYTVQNRKSLNLKSRDSGLKHQFKELLRYSQRSDGDETHSNHVRDELEKYISEEICDECEGGRLNWISVCERQDTTIVDVTNVHWRICRIL